jgi:hypothetical protein
LLLFGRPRGSQHPVLVPFSLASRSHLLGRLMVRVVVAERHQAVSLAVSSLASIREAYGKIARPRLAGLEALGAR